MKDNQQSITMAIEMGWLAATMCSHLVPEVPITQEQISLIGRISMVNWQFKLYFYHALSPVQKLAYDTENSHWWQWSVLWRTIKMTPLSTLKEPYTCAVCSRAAGPDLLMFCAGTYHMLSTSSHLLCPEDARTKKGFHGCALYHYHQSPSLA